MPLDLRETCHKTFPAAYDLGAAIVNGGKHVWAYRTEDVYGDGSVVLRVKICQNGCGYSEVC